MINQMLLIFIYGACYPMITPNTAWKKSVFGVILIRIFPYSVRMRENTDQNNYEYGHFSRSGKCWNIGILWINLMEEDYEK